MIVRFGVHRLATRAVVDLCWARTRKRSDLAGKEFEYYLRYFGAAQPDEWPLLLPGRHNDPHTTYRADIIDTWNMTITPVDGIFTMSPRDAYDFHDPARPSIKLPGKPWIAVRLSMV